MRLFIAITIGFFYVLGGAVSALAENRIALVIGNGSYQSVAPLDNPVGDAELIARTLQGLDFKVTLLTDASQGELKRTISQFGRDLRSGGRDTVGLFYYAGHGVQSFGSNYLLPVDVNLMDAADLDLVALEASAILRQMASARNRTNIVILDACRNNPFEQIASLNDNGLAEMKAPTGTYLAYATAPGSVALDGLSGNSPFTLALAEEMVVEGSPIEQVFKNVRVSVIDQTGGAQTPWDASSLTSNFVFKEGVQLTADQVAEQQLWRSVRASQDPVQLMLFLRSYPAGLYQEEARELLSEVLESELKAPKSAEKEIAKPEVADEPEIKTPDTREADLIEIARASENVEDYQAYLSEFPSGVFAELAKSEIAILRTRSEEKTVGVEAAAPEEMASVETPALGPVLFDTPLVHGPPEIVGKTIMELTQRSPLFPPIEGIPENLWKDKECSGCHQWTREDLCTQSNIYLTENGQRSLSKQHPYGGAFKNNLKAWAANGCK